MGWKKTETNSSIQLFLAIRVGLAISIFKIYSFICGQEWRGLGHQGLSGSILVTRNCSKLLNPWSRKKEEERSKRPRKWEEKRAKFVRVLKTMVKLEAN